MWRWPARRLALTVVVVLCTDLAAEASQIKAKVKLAATKRLRQRPRHPSMLRALSLKQDLLVCNAYPSPLPIEVHKSTEHTAPAPARILQPASNTSRQGNTTNNGDTEALAFKDCRRFEGRLQTHDRLDVFLQGQEVHGSFEVGDLPIADAVLLLVVMKRRDSPTIFFQDYAIPLPQGQKEAQLAVINAAADVNSTSPHLKIEDHMTGEEKETVSKRVEQLAFNRVYSLEEGAPAGSTASYSCALAAVASRSRSLSIPKTTSRTARDGGDVRASNGPPFVL